ncbi:RNA polymerase sigma-70 factor [Mucilaginibacter dorajii]|uniref:RNA polymerase sigma-70 factor n=1 Tax=Mucilaginibacter dorajii TaxID=692994 RepID=A0ABP7QZF2_9SPHI|nr:RNA polymerase sigma-70 factor [Mucilaginibacter dorajii]MCS3732299.1 RNA polymerase sigma-70 factor (ECF subfamily) [Mucilaginibacter dorajii]
MKENSPLSDDELISLMHSDQLTAFKAIYDRYWYKLYVFTNKRLRDRESSEEIVQIFFTRFWEKIETIQINQSLKSYLFSSVSYLTISHLRKEAQKNQYLFLPYAIVEEELDYSIEDTIHLKDLQLIIDNELAKLPPRCRSVFELSRKSNKSNKEIARILDISEKTVENHITNATRFLRTHLKDWLMLAIFIYKGYL